MSSEKLSLITYNLLKGAHIDGRNKLPGDPFDRLASFVGQYPRALYCLQETNGWQDNGATRIDAFTHLVSTKDYVFGKANSVYDLAVFSPRTLTQKLVLREGIKHCAVISQFEFGGTTITVVNVHLNPGTEAMRIAEIKLIMEYIDQTGPVFLVGDFNSISRLDGYGDDVLYRLRELGITKYGTDALEYQVTDFLRVAGFVDLGAAFFDYNETVPTPFNFDCDHQVPLRVDFAFANRAAARYVMSYQVLAGPLTDTISDHYPVHLELVS